MNNFLSIILLGCFGIAGFLYIPIIKAFRNMEIRLNRLGVDMIAKDFIRLKLYLDLKNNSDTELYFDKIDINLYLNSRFVGKLNNPYKQILRANSAGTVLFTVDALYAIVGNELLEILKNGRDHRITVSINGKAYFNGLPIPLPDLEVTNVTLNDFI